MNERTFVFQHVAAGGAFDRAGFRSGDVPVQHHPGLDWFCYALEQASSGNAAEVTVINVDDLANGWQPARVIPIGSLMSR
jgi:hypothetical protein